MRKLCDLPRLSTTYTRYNRLSALVESRRGRAGGGGLLQFYGSDMFGDGHGVFAVALDAVAGETETPSSTEAAAAVSETPVADTREEEAAVEPEPSSQTPPSDAHTDAVKEASEPVIDASSEAVPPPAEETAKTTGHVADEL